MSPQANGLLEQAAMLAIEDRIELAEAILASVVIPTQGTHIPKQLESETKPTTERRNWTAAELQRLPAEQRDAILAAAAAEAEEDYRTNPELRCFEAFGEEDLYVDSSDTESR